MNNFDRLKSKIVANHDFSGSDVELQALKEAILEFNRNQEEIDKNNTVPVEFEDFTKIHLSTNTKTGKNLVNYNISSAYYCFEAVEHHCKIQGQFKDEFGKQLNKLGCYACSINNRQPTTLIYDVINYITFWELSVEEIETQIRKYLENHSEVDFLRFNERGCFFSEDAFLKCAMVAIRLQDVLLGTFSYTSNDDLYNKYHNKTQFMVLNHSNSNDKGVKTTKIIGCSTKNLEKSRKMILDVINNPNQVLCCGDCSNCSYCKDKDDLRQIVFIRHGCGWDGHLESYLTEEEINNYLLIVAKDNEQFLASISC